MAPPMIGPMYRCSTNDGAAEPGRVGRQALLDPVVRRFGDGPE